jgi:hypothetical protein
MKNSDRKKGKKGKKEKNGNIFCLKNVKEKEIKNENNRNDSRKCKKN